MWALILLLALAGCGQKQAQIHFPTELAGQWHLAAKPVESLEEAWPDALVHGVNSLVVAEYRGEGNPKVLAHRMPSEAGAFDTLQRFRADTGTAAFQYGIFFVVVRSPALDQSGLNRFAAALRQGFSK